MRHTKSFTPSLACSRYYQTNLLADASISLKVPTVAKDMGPLLFASFVPDIERDRAECPGSPGDSQLRRHVHTLPQVITRTSESA